MNSTTMAAFDAAREEAAGLEWMDADRVGEIPQLVADIHAAIELARERHERESARLLALEARLAKSRDRNDRARARVVSRAWERKSIRHLALMAELEDTEEAALSTAQLLS